MDSFTLYCLMLGAMGAAGAGFVLWVAPRVDARERKRAIQPHPAE